MASSAQDQIAALVQGIQLPLMPISEEVLDVIVEGLTQAFGEAYLGSPTAVAKGNEADVTALLESHLKRRIDDDPLWRSIVAHVGRGTESINFDGEKTEKRPDLSITLTDRARSLRFPLIVEAKIIDSPSLKTVKLYCDKGVQRFLDGDYAWGCREAVMLAYVRDGSELIPAITRHLVVKNGAANRAFGTLSDPVSRPIPKGELAISHHSREFLYAHQQPPSDKPGTIALWHVWMA